MPLAREPWRWWRVEETGALVAITSEAGGWNVAQLGSAPRLAGEVRLHAADLDNNGAVDLLLLPVAPGAWGPSGRLALAGQWRAEHRNLLRSLSPLVPRASSTLPT